MLHRLCFSFRCRSYSKMGSRTVPCFNAKVLSTGGQRPPTTFAASRQRRDLIIAHTMGWGFPKGRGRNPSPFGRFKGIGFLRKGGNLPPSPASGGANSNRGHTATRRPAVLTAAPPTERRATNNVRDAADTFPPSLILVGGGESKGASPASDRAGAPRRHAAGTPEIK